MGTNVNHKIEKRILVNYKLMDLETWLKECSTQGWQLEEITGCKFTFKFTAPCRREYLVLENYITNEMRKQIPILIEFYGRESVQRTGSVGAFRRTIYWVELCKIDDDAYMGIRRKRNAFIRKQTWKGVVLASLLMAALMISECFSSNSSPFEIAAFGLFFTVIVIIEALTLLKLK